MQPSLGTSLNKPLLRNVLRKLRQIPLTGAHPAHVATAPQETLDFLAMLAGLKPVYLLGRGLDDPRWVSGVLEIAREHHNAAKAERGSSSLLQLAGILEQQCALDRREVQ